MTIRNFIMALIYLIKHCLWVIVMLESELGDNAQVPLLNKSIV